MAGVSCNASDRLRVSPVGPRSGVCPAAAGAWLGRWTTPGDDAGRPTPRYVAIRGACNRASKRRSRAAVARGEESRTEQREEQHPCEECAGPSPLQSRERRREGADA